MDWNSIAKQYSSIQETRRQIVFPWVHSYIESIRCKSLLDCGGGDGDFAFSCTDIKDLEIVIYDPAANMCDIARKNTAGLPNVVVADRLPDRLFDVVTFLTVWMCLQSEEICLNVLRYIYDHLAEDGVLIASVTHPCFRNFQFSTYHTNFDMRRYFEDGAEFNVTIEDKNRKLEIVDTHWNLTAMSRQLNESGFLIKLIKELPDIPLGKSEMKGAPWLTIIASKAK